MNHASLNALIGDLYAQVSHLSSQNEALRQEITVMREAAEAATSEAAAEDKSEGEAAEAGAGKQDE